MKDMKYYGDIKLINDTRIKNSRSNIILIHFIFFIKKHILDRETAHFELSRYIDIKE